MQRSFLTAGLLLVGATAATAQTPPLERVRANDNRARAGVTMSGTVAVRLEARLAR